MDSVVSQEAEHAALRRALGDRYVVERELGRGGMGIVLLARDRTLDRLVAIKMLPPNLAAQPEVRARFLREVRTAASLSHPNIVPIFSIEESSDAAFYVMGYVEGETLAQRVARVGPLPPGEAARITQDAAWGLGYAHGRGVVHRDVKADNILVERASGRAFVVDFGIARLADAVGLTMVGEMLGTPNYMSPEQAAGEELDGRSDLYSLGVAAFFALTGRLPFETDSVQAVLAMHLTRPAPPVATCRGGIPPKLAAAIDRCLAKEPAQRFATCEAFVAAVQDAQVARVESAPPVRLFQRVAEMATAQVVIITALLALLTFRIGPPRVLVPAFTATFLVMQCVQLRARIQALVAQGFGYEDVARAFVADRAERHGALLVASERSAPSPYWWGIAAACVLLGVGFATLSPAGGTMRALGPTLSILGLAGAIALRARSSGRLQIGGRASALTGAFWLGAVGRALFAAAVKGMRQANAVGPASVGDSLAVRRLLDGLSGPQRRELRDLPGILRQIEARLAQVEQRTRRIDAVATEMTASFGGADLAGATDAMRTTLAADLANARDAAGRERDSLLGVVNALADGLLRLRAGIAVSGRLAPVIVDARRLLGDADAGPAPAPPSRTQLPVAVLE